MMSPSERQALGRMLAVCPRLSLRAGDVRGADDFPETALLVVERGIVVVSSGGRAKRRIVLGLCARGALLPPPSVSERLAALADAVLISVSAEAQRSLLRLPAAAEAIVEALLTALRERQENLAQFANVAHADRLRVKLLQLARAYGSVVTDGVRVDVPLTHELLGQAVGSARETVTSALNTLQREGFVVREGRRYLLTISPETLASEEPSGSPLGISRAVGRSTSRVAKRWTSELELKGAGGEPVDLWRTLASHGVADLPPNVIDEEARTLETTLALPRRRARTIRIRAGRPGRVVVEGEGLAASDARFVTEAARQILRLDADLSAFYEAAREDPDLDWACAGAGRMLRSPTVFEDVVKTICTTNCAWGATVRMTTALVEHLGLEAPDGRHAFPTPAAMAEADEDFYRDTVRAGYRGAYLRSLAADVADGSIDLEVLNDPDLPDEEVAERLLALPGCGPYATAHMMMLLGRYSRLILDSWTRPKYARLNGRKAGDRTIERRFHRYRDYAGLAFWLYLTRDWVEG